MQQFIRFLPHEVHGLLEFAERSTAGIANSVEPIDNVIFNNLECFQVGDLLALLPSSDAT